MYRPLSPHIFIYKPQSSSVFSVFHRICGTILALAIILVCLFIKVVTSHINYYPIYFLTCLLHTNLSWLVISALILVVFSFFYHVTNGIRHLIWDFSKTHWLDKSHLKISVYFVLFGTMFFSTIFFLCV